MNFTMEEKIALINSISDRRSSLIRSLESLKNHNSSGINTNLINFTIREISLLNRLEERIDAFKEWSDEL